MQHAAHATPVLTIGNRRIGTGLEPYLIAEIGVNHDGDPSRAFALTDLAIASNADAVKFQYFSADLLMARPPLRLADIAGSADGVVVGRLAAYQAAAGETDPHAMLRRLELPLEVMAECIKRIHAAGRHAIVTVFSVPLVNHAAKLPWDAYKIASPDIVHRPLLEAVARLEKPMILSTGAAEFFEIQQALGWLDELGMPENDNPTAADVRTRLALLQCVSSYPCASDFAAIGAISQLEMLHPIIGYSDHTTAVDTGAVAVGRGAVLLEKHLTDDRNRRGPDHAASLNGPDFLRYVVLAKAAARANCGMYSAEKGSDAAAADVRIGSRRKVVQPCEADVRAVSRQSIVAIRNLSAGHVLSPMDLTFRRPGNGLAPFQVREVVGQMLRRDVQAHEALTADIFAQEMPVVRAVGRKAEAAGVALPQ